MDLPALYLSYKVKASLDRSPMNVATLSSKNQVTLPSDLRQALGLKPGDWVAFAMEGRHAVLRIVPRADVLALAGMGRAALKGEELHIKRILVQRARARYRAAG
jgi:AbrB family looped-hinge helix DNA binding protein